MEERPDTVPERYDRRLVSTDRQCPRCHSTKLHKGRTLNLERNAWRCKLCALTWAEEQQEAFEDWYKGDEQQGPGPEQPRAIVIANRFK